MQTSFCISLPDFELPVSLSSLQGDSIYKISVVHVGYLTVVQISKTQYVERSDAPLAVKTLAWVTTFLGCLSCTSVTNKCYQIGFKLIKELL